MATGLEAGNSNYCDRKLVRLQPLGQWQLVSRRSLPTVAVENLLCHSPFKQSQSVVAQGLEPQTMAN